MLSVESAAEVKDLKFFKNCIVVRTFNTRSTLNKFLSVQYSIVNCRHNVVQWISKTYSSCIIEISCQLIGNSLIFSALRPRLLMPPPAQRRCLALAQKTNPSLVSSVLSSPTMPWHRNIFLTEKV